MSEQAWAAMDDETLIRVWQPGDGLACTQAKKNRMRPCGEPVAVTKTAINCVRRSGMPDPVMVAFRGHDRRDITITRVLCLRHVASLFDSKLGAPGDNNVERRALEELAQRYWDQYQEIQDRLTEELVEARYSVLPNEIRSKVVALLREPDSQEVSA